MTTMLERPAPPQEAELERLRAELMTARAAAAAAREEERRRLERDLHDGAQQNLIVTRMKVALAESLASGAADELRTLLGEIQADLADALADIRGVLRGASPCRLDVLGLRLALVEHARDVPLPVEVLCADLRYPSQIETSVFFCCAEAIQNVIKHARAAHCLVRVWQTDRRLHFEVRDDGRGFEVTRPRAGMGLRNLRDRLTTLGGELAVRSRPGSGTTVQGSVPLDGVTPAATRLDGTENHVVLTIG